MVTAAALRTHLDYSAWASRRMVEAIRDLPEAELTRDFGTADKSILGTLVHVFAADRVWLDRVLGNTPQTFLVPERDVKLEVLINEWPAIYDRWKAWAANLTDANVLAKAAYRDLKGNPYETPLWQILLHVVNHGTHHRGQAAGFLRTLGHKPPPLDLIFYYRELP
ncbi:MAG: DinB family protein [Bryobacteraceae bacterium]